MFDKLNSTEIAAIVTTLTVCFFIVLAWVALWFPKNKLVNKIFFGSKD